MKNILKIPKEQLRQVNFHKLEVLYEKPQRQWRLHNLRRALVLGNIEHNHANIIFKTEDGSLHQVEATIWAVTDDYISLKGGSNIPVRAIVDIEY